MSQSLNPRKLDDLLAGAVDLTARPDFAAWRQKHPEAVDALQSLPTILSKRRSKMIRIARYSTSVALVLFVAVTAWWMFFGHGTAASWAQVIDQIAKVRNATCRVSVHAAQGQAGQISTVVFHRPCCCLFLRTPRAREYLNGARRLLAHHAAMQKEGPGG